MKCRISVLVKKAISVKTDLDQEIVSSAVAVEDPLVSVVVHQEAAMIVVAIIHALHVVKIDLLSAVSAVVNVVLNEVPIEVREVSSVQVAKDLGAVSVPLGMRMMQNNHVHVSVQDQKAAARPDLWSVQVISFLS